MASDGLLRKPPVKRGLGLLLHLGSDMLADFFVSDGDGNGFIGKSQKTETPSRNQVDGKNQIGQGPIYDHLGRSRGVLAPESPVPPDFLIPPSFCRHKKMPITLEGLKYLC